MIWASSHFDHPDLMTKASWLIVPDCGTIFHLDCGGQTCLSQCLDRNLRHYCLTAVLSDFIVLLMCYINTVYVCMYLNCSYIRGVSVRILCVTFC